MLEIALGSALMYYFTTQAFEIEKKPEGTVFEPSNTVPLGPWSMYKNVLAEYNLKQR